MQTLCSQKRSLLEFRNSYAALFLGHCWLLIHVSNLCCAQQHEMSTPTLPGCRQPRQEPFTDDCQSWPGQDASCDEGITVRRGGAQGPLGHRRQEKCPNQVNANGDGQAQGEGLSSPCLVTVSWKHWVKPGGTSGNLLAARAWRIRTSGETQIPLQPILVGPAQQGTIVTLTQQDPASH